MKINVARLKQEIGARQSFSFDSPVAEIDTGELQEWLEGSLAVTGEVVNNGRFLNITGVIRGSSRHECDRCLKQYNRSIEIPFDENFLEAGSEQVEANAERTYYEGDEIDITELVRETLVLSEPLKKLCAENCKGLCPKCGVNRNDTDCSCDLRAIDPRLAALQKLLDKKD